MKRRNFVSTAIAAASAAEAAPTLAIDGGAPIREKALRPGYWGSEFYDDKERAELNDVIDAKAPFRWYFSRATASSWPATHTASAP